MKNEDFYKQIEVEAEHNMGTSPYVVLRLDGNSFSKFTKNMVKPFDETFEDAMNDAAIAVLKYCDGAKFAYVQSDEISILLAPNQPFLSNRTQKIASLCAATCTLAFSKHFDRDAIFDCRVFPLDGHNISGYFNWRRHDCRRNCISSIAHHMLGGGKRAHQKLHGLSTVQKIEEGSIEEVYEHHFEGRVIAKIKRLEKLREVMPEKKFQELIDKGYIEEGTIVERGSWELLDITPPFTEEFICETLKGTSQEMLKSFLLKTSKPKSLKKVELLSNFAKEPPKDL